MHDVQLDQIRAEDLEFLRRLRNAERRWFFDQTEITPDAQAAWYRSLQHDRRSRWFMVRVGGERAGCFSIRVDEHERAEVRCILLSPEFRGQGVMNKAIGDAMTEMGDHLRYFTEVMPDNENSLKMFERLGFRPRFVSLERTAK